MGGEKYKVHVYNTVDKGSPPHGRGKDDTAVQLGARAGITPAWAGKSRGQHGGPCAVENHPCVGGEKRFASASLDAYWGSPPRRRGKVRAGELGHGPGRITPA